MRRIVLVFMMVLTAIGAAAQELDDAAALVADRVYLSEGLLIAEGNVEVVFEKQRLTASKIIFEPNDERLQVEGPIVFTTEDGDRLLASRAEIDRQFEAAILTSARAVVDRQLQVAANEVLQGGNRYTQFTKAVASSCRVCKDHPTPLWEIRAERIVQDSVERQIYFTKAQFRVVGIPVLYVPKLRLPAPGNDRARGFLQPRVITSTELGFGLQVPYFIPLGDHKDITLAPYVSPDTRTLGFRYRQAFWNGNLELNGAVSDDDLRDGLRAYVFAQANFQLPRDFLLALDLELATDDDYLLQYDISDKSRLDSSVQITRVREDELILGRATHYRSLRLRDNGETLPFLEGRGEYVRTFGTVLGGRTTLSVVSLGYAREAVRDFDTAADLDTIPDGRDAQRLGARLDWRRSTVFGPGLEASVIGRLDAQAYGVMSDRAFPETIRRLVPTLGVELRWPLRRRDPRGASVLEPVVQVLWTDPDFDAAPNEDSTRVAFDEGNLFGLSRFPGGDEIERGLRANLGLTWTRYKADGTEARLTFGRVLRDEDYGQFVAGSGLDGNVSDWLVSGQVRFPTGTVLEGRVLTDDEFDLSLGELRGRTTVGGVTFDGAYVWLAGQTFTDGITLPQTSELQLAAVAQITPAWDVSLAARYDFETSRTADSTLVVGYENECIEADLTVRREFTSRTALSPETRFGLSVGLKGFGDRKAGGPVGACGPHEY